MKQAEQARLFLRKAAEDESLLDAILIRNLRQFAEGEFGPPPA